MAFRIFISHSVAPKELGIVYAIINEGSKRGVVPFIPDRSWNPSEGLTDRVSSSIKDADFLLAIATGSGMHLDWLNKEILQASLLGKPLLIIVDDTISMPDDMKHIKIDRANPSKTINEASRILEQYGKDKESKELLTLIGIGGLLFLLLMGVKK